LSSDEACSVGEQTLLLTVLEKEQYMRTLNEVEVKAVLAMVRDSEKLVMGLKVSISSSSSELSAVQDGLEKYIGTKKRQFELRLLSLLCKTALKKIASIILAFIW